MLKPIVISSAAAAELESLPIPSDWILAGSPEARAKLLAKSHDGASRIVVWECTAGRFNWHYSEDETVVVIAGEVFVTTETGDERRLGEGDMGFFPAGSSAIMARPRSDQKSSGLRRDLPGPLAFGLRAWHRLLRIVAARGRSSLSPAPL